MIDATSQAALTVVFGAVAGGVTNSVAIWMLFHPYEPPRLFGRPFRSLQGAIPKNKARLAAAVGRAVGTRLLTAEDLARTAAEPAFRQAFDERLTGFIRGVLDRPRGSLAETLPAPLAAELRALLDETAAGLLSRLDAYLAGDEFRAEARRWAASLASELADRPIGELLTPEREAALASAAERWIADAVGGTGFEAAVADYIDRTANRLLEPDRTFQELLPAGLVAAVEKAIAGYLPLAIERLAGLLENPDARHRVERVLHELLDRFMRDLKFHQRLIASLVITPETVDRVLQAVEAEGAAKLAEVLQDPAVRDAMAKSVNDAIVDLLRRPVAAVLGRPGDPSVEDAKATVAGWGLSLARDPQTRAFLVEKLQATLHAAERTSWGDLFRHVPPERIADAIVAAARSDRARAVYREAAGRLVARLFERPIGRIADHLPADAAARVEGAIADPLWDWLQDQVPAVARRIDIAGQVERKILEFPMERVEELIRSVTERELIIIVRLGYLLGGLIGVISATLNLVL
ncbi:MAG TPA: DUF445 family protein [Longimicrobiales bacterium]